MSRVTLTLPVLIVAGAMLAACADQRATAPTAIASHGLAFDREAEGSAHPTIVRGTGNPAIDVAAVQAAVNQGGSVILKGHFSFDIPPSSSNGIAPALIPSGLPANSEIKITKAVSISG